MSADLPAPVPRRDSLFSEPEKGNESRGNSDSDTDEDVSWAARRRLCRSDRALCRTLTNVYNFLPAAVGRRFGWHEKTVRKASNNQYSPPDNVSHDAKKLPVNFNTIVAQMTAERESGNVSTRTEARKQTRKPQARPAQFQVNVEDRKPILPKAPTAPTAPTAPRARAAPAMTPDEKFLRAFVAQVGLDPVWCRVLRDAGFTEETLCQLARSPEKKVKQFLSETFTEMREVNIFLFAQAVGRLPIPLD
ncbi:hypothetical protein DFH09DRAFT_1286659 [Mycena vulgaris]|nr:hypothetical protein DFH09DRAFT_1286659 [Mycena vulgaris]